MRHWFVVARNFECVLAYRKYWLVFRRSVLEKDSGDTWQVCSMLAEADEGFSLYLAISAWNARASSLHEAP